MEYVDIPSPDEDVAGFDELGGFSRAAGFERLHHRGAVSSTHPTGLKKEKKEKKKTLTPQVQPSLPFLFHLS